MKLFGSTRSKERILLLTLCGVLLSSCLLLASCGGEGGQTTAVEQTKRKPDSPGPGTPYETSPSVQQSTQSASPPGSSVREPALPDSTTPVPPSPSETK